MSLDAVLDVARHGGGDGLQGGALHLGREARTALSGGPRVARRERLCHDPRLPARGRRGGVRGNRPTAALEPRQHDASGNRQLAAGLAVDGHHAGIGLGAAHPEGNAALRLAGQGAGGAPADAGRCRASEGALHHRDPHRHRRDALGAHRVAARHSPHPRRTRAHPGDHRPELPRQAGDEDAPGAGTGLERTAVDHRRGAHSVRAGDEHPGAAEPEPGRTAEDRRRGHRRLGRRLALDAGFREPGSAVAASGRTGPRDCFRRQGTARTPDHLSALRQRRGHLGGRRLAQRGARQDRRRRPAAHGRLVPGRRHAAAHRSARAHPRAAEPGFGGCAGAHRSRGSRRRSGLDGSRDRAPDSRPWRRFQRRRPSRRPASPRAERQRRLLRRQPQHQLHQHLLLQVPVLRLLEGQAGGESARQALRPERRGNPAANPRSRGPGAAPKCACRAASIRSTPAPPTWTSCAR